MGEKVVIVGGGAVGLASAYFLAKQNKQVVIIDKDEIGHACSQGNMGWVMPILTEPVPSPGLVKKSFKWMFKKDSPLYIDPLQVPKMSNWLMQFRKHCNEKDYHDGERALLELHQETVSLFEQLQNEIPFEMHERGFLFLFIDEDALNETYDALKIKAGKVQAQTPIRMTRAELIEIQPNISEKVKGGILLPRQKHVRPESFLEKLGTHLSRLGVEFQSNKEVIGFLKEGNKINGVQTNNGDIAGEQFLIATGAWTSLVGKYLGYTIPIEAGKGYSITVTRPKNEIKYPMYLGDSKVGLSPYDGGLRIGGTMELSGLNTTLNQNRLKSIRNSVSDYLDTEIDDQDRIEWTGMRPMTPDGLPILGGIPGLENVFIASGHNMEGISLALATGKVMSKMMSGEEVDKKIKPFLLERFN